VRTAVQRREQRQMKQFWFGGEGTEHVVRLPLDIASLKWGVAAAAAQGGSIAVEFPEDSPAEVREGKGGPPKKRKR